MPTTNYTTPATGEKGILRVVSSPCPGAAAVNLPQFTWSRPVVALGRRAAGLGARSSSGLQIPRALSLPSAWSVLRSMLWPRGGRASTRVKGQIWPITRVGGRGY